MKGNRPVSEPDPVVQTAARSLTVAGWTLVGRVTGVARVLVVAAVLGPTYFGNTFQAMNLIPTWTFLFLTGSLFTSILVPPLVRVGEEGGTQEMARLAGSLLGLAIAVFAGVVLIVTAAGPLVVGALSLGVDDPAAATAQQRVGWPLLAMLMPQVILYGIAGVGAAAQNARGRFALAAAAPAAENILTMAVLGLVALVFGVGVDVGEVTGPQLAVLGIGSTAAVALHAGLQWWGAARAGLRLRPSTRWRDAEVRSVVRRAGPSLGHAALECLPYFAILAAANRVPGGVIAFGLAIQFLYFPIGIAVRPVATTLLPQLASLALAGALHRFRSELIRAASLSMIVVVPAAVSYVVLARPLAATFSFGEMSVDRGVTLLAASIASVGPGVLGEAAFVLATCACYARNDTRSPFHAMAARAFVSFTGILLTFTLSGTAVLVALGAAISAGNLVGARILVTRAGRGLPLTGPRIGPALVRTLVASMVMAVVAYLTSSGVGALLDGRVGAMASLSAAGVVGLGAYAAVQLACRAPEFRYLAAALRRGRGGGLAPG